MARSEMMWAMERTRKWVEAGCDPRHEDAPNWSTLSQMEEDGLVRLDAVRTTAQPSRLVVTLTALGEFEADRLEAFFERNPDALKPNEDTQPAPL